MKWTYFPLAADDKRATAQLLENLSCCRTLGSKLESRFSIGEGEMFAIEMEELDVHSLPTFGFATYKSGKTWYEASGSKQIPIGKRPIDGLICFLTEFFRVTNQGTVVIQNPFWDRKDAHWNSPTRLQHCLPTHHAFFLDEVYHVLTPHETAPDLMEDTIREAWHHWLVGVCAEHVMIPDDNLFSEEFLDELVDKTKHVFVSAFDEGGFLIWTPGQRKVTATKFDNYGKDG